MHNKKNRLGYSCLIGSSVENDSHSNFAENIVCSFLKFVTAVLSSFPRDWTAAIFESSSDNNFHVFGTLNL